MIRHGWGVAIVVAVASLWMLRLGFVVDDFLWVGRSARNFLPEPCLGEDPCSGERLYVHGRGEPLPGRFLFRPTTFAFWWALANAGETASPLLFRAALIAMHALAAWAVFALVRRAAPPGAAAVAGILFGLAPGSLQAVTWISGAGDILSTLFLLLAACLLARERGGAARDVSAGLAFGLAVAAKESAIFFAPALLVVPLARRRSPGAPLHLRRLALCLALPLAAFALARYLYTGDLIPGPIAGGKEHHATTLEFLAQAAAPWWGANPVTQPYDPMAARAFGDDPAATRWVLRVIGAVLWMLPLAAGLLARPRFLLPLAGLVLVGAIGTFPIYHAILRNQAPIIDNATARMAYPFTALALIALGLALAGIRRSALRVALIAPLALWQTDFLVHVARVEAHATAVVKQRLTSFDDVARAGPPGARFLAVDPMDDLDGVALGVGIERAFQPPFRRPGVPVTWLPDTTDVTFGRIPCVMNDDAALVLAQVRDGRYSARGPIAPPLPASMPALRPDGPGRFRFKIPVPVRALAALRLTFAPGPDERAVSVSLLFTDGVPDTRTFTVHDAAGGPTVLLDLGARETFDARLVTLLDTDADLAAPPVPLRDLPRVAVDPIPSPTSDMPVVSFTTPPEAVSHEIALRVTYGGEEPVDAVVRPDEAALHAAGPRRRFEFTPDVVVARGVDEIRWSLAVAVIGARPRERDIRVAPLELRVIALDRHGLVAGRSDWVWVHLRR